MDRIAVVSFSNANASVCISVFANIFDVLRLFVMIDCLFFSSIYIYKGGKL